MPTNILSSLRSLVFSLGSLSAFAMAQTSALQFLYGSDMDVGSLQDRTPSASPVRELPCKNLPIRQPSAGSSSQVPTRAPTVVQTSDVHPADSSVYPPVFSAPPSSSSVPSPEADAEILQAAEVAAARTATAASPSSTSS